VWNRIVSHIADVISNIIFWYYWDHDSLFKIDDYEPVIIVFRNILKKRIATFQRHFLIVRPGWKYEVYCLKQSLNVIDHSPFVLTSFPPQVLLKKGPTKELDFHHPHARTWSNNERFHRELDGNTRRVNDYPRVHITRKDVPGKTRMFPPNGLRIVESTMQ
jgi:hypothetical protein